MWELDFKFPSEANDLEKFCKSNNIKFVRKFSKIYIQDKDINKIRLHCDKIYMTYVEKFIEEHN